MGRRGRVRSTMTTWQSPARSGSCRTTCASSASRPRTRSMSMPSRDTPWLPALRLRGTRPARRALRVLPQPRHLVEPRPPRPGRGCPGGARPRRAVRLLDVPLARHAHRGWTSLPEAERDRLSKKNLYRVLKRFATRRDLLVSPGADPASNGRPVALRDRDCGTRRSRCSPNVPDRVIVTSGEASRDNIVPPAVWHCEASLHVSRPLDPEPRAPGSVPEERRTGSRGVRPYTPATGRRTRSRDRRRGHAAWNQT